MTDLAVRRLRTSGTRAAAEALLRGAVGDVPDRSVLIVRQLRVAGSDPGAARRRLAQLRRTAARPSPGDSRIERGSAEAVLFEDEAHLLACLTADLVDGTAEERWYWRPRLTRGGTRPLLWAWLDDLRWLPAAAELLERLRPGLVRTGVESLTPAERLSVATAAIEAGVRLSPAFVWEEPDRSAQPIGSDASEPPPGAQAWASTTKAPGAADRVPPATRPGPPPVGAPDRTAPSATAHSAAQLVRPRGSGLLAAPWPGARHAWRAPDPDIGRASPSSGDETRTTASPTFAPSARDARPGPVAAQRTARTGQPPLTRQTPVGIAPAGTADTPEHARADPGPSPARGRSVAAARPTWLGAPSFVDSRLAGVCYLLPLMLRLSGAAGRGGSEPSWTELTAFSRRVLRPRRHARRRAADPLWGVLATLAQDNRETGRRTPAPWWPEAGDFLARHEVGPSQLMTPGRIAVTRTHVDVVFTLDQIDLRVRGAGLDHDPGWVPSLGRIVSFHFL
jgi:hypothetical protein